MEERDFIVKIVLTNVNHVNKMKPIRLKKKRLVFCILSTFLLLVLLIFPAYAATEWKISPSNPSVGDTLKITGPGGKSIDAQISVLVKVPVSRGRYKLSLKNIKIPGDHIKNIRITARAEGVKNLHVAVKKGVTVDRNVAASGGVATISASNVPPLTYDILIDGDALSGRSSVNLRFTASGTLTAISTNPKGESKYSFDTSSLPAGKLTVNIEGSGQTGSSGQTGGSGQIGGSEQTMDLKPKEQNASAQPVSKLNSITTRLKNIFSSFWKL